MNDPLAEMLAYKAMLIADDIRATTDGRDINPPCVLIRPPTLHFRFGRGCTGADWEARLYIPDAGTDNSLRTALPLLQQIQDALGGIVVTATPGDFALPDGGTVPGYLLTWSSH